MSEAFYVSGYCSLILLPPALVNEGKYYNRSCNNFCLIIVVWENDLSGQTYLYRIICRHSQILANTPNIMGTLRSAECPRNIERITSSKFFSLGMVYSKPLGGKSRIVKLVREMKKEIGSFTWAVLYMYIYWLLIDCLLLYTTLRVLYIFITSFSGWLYCNDESFIHKLRHVIGYY